ncbi:32162_t:CDS:2, partial [Racocetra persica]
QTLFDFSVSNLFDKSDATLKIGNFLIRQQISKVIIKSLLNQDTTERNEIMINILSDEEYEVRVTVLEMLLEYFLEMDVIHIGTSVMSMIQSKLITMIYHEERYPKCIQLIVELLILINPDYPFPKSNLISSQQLSIRLDLEEFCKKLFRYMEKLKSSSIIEATLILLGALTAEIWNETSLPHEFRSLSLKTWAEYINKNTKPEITLTRREAATKSLQLFSRLLFKKETIFTNNDDIQYFISLYIALIRLTQDDDIDIRRTAALIVSKAMGLEVVDCDRARELCYEYMTNQYSKSLYLYVALLQILTRDVKPDEILKSEMTPSRVLFAIENPNIYKEDLVDIQLAYKYLLIAIKKERNRLEFPEMFRKDIPMFCVKQLVMVCEFISSREVQTNKNGPIGFTSLPNVFIVMYRVIATVSVMIELVSDTESISKDVRIIIDKLTHDRIQLHPLLNDLLLGELSQNCFNIITKGEDKDGNEFMTFSKEFE